jgi:hypothetical protein
MDMSEPVTRRGTIGAVASAAAAVAAASLPALASEPDPIFAAIERHRAFMAEARAARRDRAAWEDRVIFASRRDGNRVHFETIRQHPEYPAWQAREETTAGRWNPEKLLLLETVPSTLAGLTALAAYLLDAHRHDEQIFSNEGDTGELLGMFDRAMRNLAAVA